MWKENQTKIIAKLKGGEKHIHKDKQKKENKHRKTKQKHFCLIFDRANVTQNPRRNKNNPCQSEREDSKTEYILSNKHTSESTQISKKYK